MGQWPNFTLTSLAGSGGFLETSSGTMTLIISTTSESGFGGSIAEGAGLVSLLKTGSGTLILSGSNTFTGGTTVAAGILEVESFGGLPVGSVLTVGGGASALFAPVMGGPVVRLRPQQPPFPSLARLCFC